MIALHRFLHTPTQRRKSLASHSIRAILAAALPLVITACAAPAKTADTPKETCLAQGDPQKPSYYLCGNGGADGALKADDGWRFAASQAQDRWLEIRFPQAQWIRTIYVDNGCADGQGSVAEVELTTPDGQLLRYKLEPGKDKQMMTLPQWGEVRSFRLAISALIHSDSQSHSGASVCLRHVQADLKEQHLDQLALESCEKRTPKDQRKRCLRDLRQQMQDNLRQQSAKLPAGQLRNANEQWLLWVQNECDTLARLMADSKSADLEADRCYVERVSERTWQMRRMNERLRERTY